MDRLILRIIVGAIFVAAFGARPVQAAEPSVHLVGPVGQVQAGTIWPVEVRLDTGGLNINAAEIHLIVTGSATEITRLGRESSIMTLWPEVPQINSATAKFVGGRPGGVVAVDALLGTIFVVAREAGPVKVSLLQPVSGLYLHDGAGSKVAVGQTAIEVQVADDLVPSVELTSRTHPDESTWGRAGEIEISWTVQPNEEFSYRLSNDIGTVPDDDIDTGTMPLRFDGLDDGIWYFTIKRRMPNQAWSPIFQRRFLLDGTPPEPFSVVQPAAETVGGKNILTWSALDRTAGVVAYHGFVNAKKIGTVSSPLTLQEEWRGQALQIVAIDAAGNQRVSPPWMYGARRVPIPWWGWGIIIAALFGLAFEVGRVFRRRG